MMRFRNGRRLLAIGLLGMICHGVVAAQTTARSPLPVPAGPYSVGRTHFDWLDHSRRDTDNPNGYRELMVWLWYPASVRAGTEPAEWMPGKWGELFWTQYMPLRFPDAAANGKTYPISSIRTHAFPDASVLSGKTKFPVLLFEPGLGVTPFSYATLIEDLVSHGYIVAGIVPTYYTTFSVFSDGHIAEDRRPRATDSAVYEALQARMFEFWTGDMIFTANQLEKLNAGGNSQFKKRLDLKRIGAFGHSFGGAASLQVARDDVRVLAALNLDGTMHGDVRNEGLCKPLLLFYHPPPDADLDSVVFRDGKPSYRLTLAGSTHSFATDFGLLPFVTENMRAQMGSIDPKRALSITRVYVEAFFDQYLMGNPSPLLAGTAPEYPELTLETN